MIIDTKRTEKLTIFVPNNPKNQNSTNFFSFFAKKVSKKFDLYQPFYYLCTCFPMYPTSLNPNNTTKHWFRIKKKRP